MNEPTSARSAGSILLVMLLVSAVAGIGYVMVTAAISKSRDHTGTKKSSEPKPEITTVAAAFVPPETTGYVGSQACAECHEELFERYSSHPMYAGATRPVHQDANAPSGLKAALPGIVRSLSAEVFDGGKVVHHDRMHDGDGKLIYDDVVPMDFVLGSGRRAKAYLRQRGEIITSSALNWFSKSGEWELNPGYEPDDPRRFDRRVQANCLHCHTGHVAVVSRGSDRFVADNPIIESPIGCERCHGPGQAHVEHHENSNAGTDPIVNPHNLEQTERESVCYQCHLQPSYSRVLRVGRTHLDFRPGMKMEDIWTMVNTTDTVDKSGATETVRQVQQMRESACYVQSGSMSCTSCHDPHGLPNPAEAVAYFRDRCLDCHESVDACSAPPVERKAKNNACTTCHMPEREVQQAVHLSQTDHRILRSPGQVRSRPAKSGVTFFDNQGDRLPAAERQRAIAIAVARKGAPFSGLLEEELTELLTVFPKDGPLLIAHGSVTRMRGNVNAAVGSFEQAALLVESDEIALTTLVDVYYEAQNWSGAISAAERLLKLDPESSRVYAILADSLANAGRLEDGIAAAEQALQFNPSLAVLHQWLAVKYEEQGNAAESERHRKTLERMQTARPQTELGEQAKPERP